MPEKEEIAFNETVRGLQGQAQDLEAIRSHVNVALSAGGISAAVLASQTQTHGLFFWIAIAAFVLLAIATATAYWPVRGWVFDFVAVTDGDRDIEIVPTYVDNGTTPESMLKTLASEATKGYQKNRDSFLSRRWRAHDAAIVFLVLEVFALLGHLAWDGSGPNASQRSVCASIQDSVDDLALNGPPSRIAADLQAASAAANRGSDQTLADSVFRARAAESANPGDAGGSRVLRYSLAPVVDRCDDIGAPVHE